MNKNSALYQLMCLRMNGIMNSISNQDEEYQALLSEIDRHAARLEAIQLPKETMHLVDQCISGYNAAGSRYGMLAYLLGFSDCQELLLNPVLDGKESLAHEHI